MGKYETLQRRFLAALLDAVIYVPVWLIFRGISEQSGPFGQFVCEALSGFFYVFYYVVCHARSGQTLGKYVFDVRVVDISERPVSFLQATLRSAPQLLIVSAGIANSNAGLLAPTTNEWILTVAILVSIGYSLFSVANVITMYVNSKRRALHDYLAGTVVVLD